MTDGFDIERFRQLAQSYGADIEKWPEAGRDAARTIALRDDAQTILEDEGRLDAMLATWSPQAVPEEFVKATSAIAVVAGDRLIHKVKIWWASIGIAAALSGVATGTAATALLGHTPQSYNGTVFGDLDDGDD